MPKTDNKGYSKLMKFGRNSGRFLGKTLLPLGFQDRRLNRSKKNSRTEHGFFDLITREVSQKSKSCFPCSVGSILFCASHARWEANFSVLRHLSTNKATKYVFCFPPSMGSTEKKQAFNFFQTSRKNRRGTGFRSFLLILYEQEHSF